MGESARSLYERAKEHHEDEESRKEDSHRMKHWVLDHPSLLDPPRFKIKVVSSYRDPLNRQVGEAVRIEMRGGNTLNSKTEYNRCRIPRLVIDQEVWQIMRKKQKEINDEETKNLEEELQPADFHEIQAVIGPEKETLKRKDTPSSRKNAKKLKLVQLDGWGENPVSEPKDGMNSWLLRSSHEEQEDHPWPQVSSQGSSKRMKQLELSFSRILLCQRQNLKMSMPEGWMNIQTNFMMKQILV